MTLIETVISMAVMGLALAGIVLGYLLSSTRAEWSAYDLAGHSLAMQKLEQTRAAKWDLLTSPPVDELQPGNLAPDPQMLDIPQIGDHVVWATNYTIITQISSNPPLKMVRVDCVWPFMDKGLFTNTIYTYRAPDR